MAYTREQIHEYRQSISDDSDASFKMMAYYASRDPRFDEDEDWSSLCEYMADAALAEPGVKAFLNSYEAAARQGCEVLTSKIEADMRDNYILAGVALHVANLGKALPAAAWAAFNKKQYAGLPGEWALLRFLGWSGFDLNAVDAGGSTPLHYMASQNNAPYSSPKAVAWLIENGADVDAKNAQGDTPLIYMSGARSWSRELSLSFAALVNAGANPFEQANDGESSESLLSKLDAQGPHPERRHLLNEIGALRAAIERAELDAVAEPGKDVGSKRPMLAI